MPEANPSNVRVEIDTELTDNAVSDLIDRVERDWQREYDATDFADTQHIQDFEATLTALRIASGRGRRAASETRESASIEYETSEVDNLRQRVRQLDPGNSFGLGTVRRDTDRHISTTDLDE